MPIVLDVFYLPLQIYSPQLPLDTQTVTVDMVNVELIWGITRKWCEITARTNREKSTIGPCNNDQKFYEFICK